MLEYINPFRIVRYFQDIRRHALAVSRQYGLPVMRIVREQVALNRLNGMRRDEYYKYHLFDPALSWEDKCAFVSDVELRALQRRINPHSYYYLLKNKLIFKRYFADAGIPVAPLLGVYDPKWGTMEVGSRRSEVDMSAVVKEEGRRLLRGAEDIQRLIDGVPEGKGIVFKPIEGSEGQMVKVFPIAERVFEQKVTKKTKTGGTVLVSVSGERVSADLLVRCLSDPVALERAYSGGSPRTAFLVESYVRGHRDLSSLCGQTLCTCRLVTLVETDGEVSILGAVFKLAPSEAGVDNLHAGGMSVGIELETGRLCKGRTMADMWRPYRSALDSGARFEGVLLPEWPAVKEMARRAALAFPLLPCIGWDIAISDQGPVMIEGNWGWAADLMQIGMHRGIGPRLRKCD